MIYLDTGIVVRALMSAHPQHADCFPFIGKDAFTSCHTIAETFNTLTGFFKIANDDASALIASLVGQIQFETIQETDYLEVIR